LSILNVENAQALLTLISAERISEIAYLLGQVRDLELQLQEHLQIVEQLKKQISEESKVQFGNSIVEPEAAQEALNDSSIIEDVC
jgi:ABC-type Fe3+-citrate transport system substrate-binding protein